MRCQARRWAHSLDPRHETEQRGYEFIGAVIKRRRLEATLTQRELEHLSGIDQTVISRLENGKQYGLRWSRFAMLVAALDGLEGGPSRPEPWWIAARINPPAYAVDRLRAEGLIPPDSDERDPDRDVEEEV
jgi:transcriptional regulator with XRE-family HTH domain